MEYRRFGKKIVVRMDPGEEILTVLQTVCEVEHITLAEVRALGALASFRTGLFDTAEKSYHGTEFTMPTEITSLWGTVTIKDGAFYPHIHMSAADETGNVHGGHLNSAVVSATCEMVIDEMDGVVERTFSEQIGLNLLRFL